MVAVKESSGNLAQIAEIARTLPRRQDPALRRRRPGPARHRRGRLGPGQRHGQPRSAARPSGWCAWPWPGRRQEALALHHALLPLMDALFLESNPIPLKAALELLGICGDTLRLPLTAASAATRARLAELLPLQASRWPDGASRAFYRRPMDDDPGRPGPGRGLQAAPGRPWNRAPPAPPSAGRRWRLARQRLGEDRHPGRLPLHRHRRGAGLARPLFDRAAYPPRGLHPGRRRAPGPGRQPRCAAAPTWPRAW